MEPKITYIRNKKNFPVACLAYVCDRENERATYALSVHNPKDHYDRKLAVSIALARLNKFSESSMNGSVNTYGCVGIGDIINVIMENIIHKTNEINDLCNLSQNIASKGKKKFPALLRSAAKQYMKHKNEI